MSSDLTIGSTAKNKKPSDQSSSRMAKLVYGAEEGWLDKSSRSIHINEGILSSMRKSIQPIDTKVDVPLIEKIKNQG